jgi:hypothetical protein
MLLEESVVGGVVERDERTADVERCGRGSSVEYESREKSLPSFYWRFRRGRGCSCIRRFRDESLVNLKVSTCEGDKGKILTRREIRTSPLVLLEDACLATGKARNMR